MKKNASGKLYNVNGAQTKSNKNNVNKTLDIKVSFQRTLEDSQRWAETDRVRVHEIWDLPQHERSESGASAQLYSSALPSVH